MAGALCCPEEPMKEEKSGGRSKWEVESDLRSVREASLIMGDKKRMKSVGILAEKETSALSKIAKLKGGLGKKD